MFRLYIAIGAFILLLASGGGVAWKYQQAKLRASTSDLKSCVEASETTNATVQAMLDERDVSSKLCTARLAAKDALFIRLQEIDRLSSRPTNSTTGGNDGDANTDAENLAKRPDLDPAHTNTLLGVLNRVYPAHGGQDRICAARSAGDAGGTSVLPGAVLYCFCSDDDVKNWLKNQAVRDAHDSDVKNIILNLQEATK